MEWSYCEGINGAGYFAEIQCLGLNRKNCRLMIGYQTMRERDGFVWHTGPIEDLRPHLRKVKDVMHMALYTFLDGVIEGLRFRDQELLKQEVESLVSGEEEAAIEVFGAF